MTLFTEQPRVLIVDDTLENINILMSILMDQYEVSVATNGEKALKIAAMEDPSIDLILLDIVMPEMDGYEVCAKLKGEPENCQYSSYFCNGF
jgi:Response regulator containing a CheY-like receiver domain and an HD-GYP domain